MSGDTVTLWVVGVDASLVTATGFALDLRVSPHILLALIAPPPSVSNLALALAKVGVTGAVSSLFRADRIAVTGLAALPAGNLPVVLNAPLAVLTRDIGEAVADTAGAIAGRPIRVCTELVTSTLVTLVVDRIAPPPSHAVLTVPALSVEDTFHALASMGITVAILRLIPVLVAVAALTAACWHLRVAEEVVIAHVTLVASVAINTVAGHLVRGGVQFACVLPGKAVSTCLGVGALALPALHLVSPQFRTTIVADDTLVAEVPHGGISAVVALAGGGLAGVRVAITLALATVGEVPVARLALVTLPPKGWLVGVALALAAVLVAEFVLAAGVVALAPVTPGAGEAVGGRGTGVAPTPHHQGLAVTATIVLVAHVLIGSRSVAVAVP